MNSSVFLSVAMLAAIALAVGGVVHVRRNEKRGWLMLVMAAVLVGNVAILSL